MFENDDYRILESQDVTRDGLMFIARECFERCYTTAYEEYFIVVVPEIS